MPKVVRDQVVDLVGLGVAVHHQVLDPTRIQLPILDLDLDQVLVVRGWRNGMAIFVCVVSICCKYCNTEETPETKPTDNNSDFIVTQSKV
ncbi:unnamed protein product [Caenorhabditis brenneri]